VLPLAAAVVAPSTGLLQLMRQQWRLPAKKAVYIPNGIDTNRFHPPPKESHARSVVIIGTAGHLRAEKNHGMLIRAAVRALAQTGYPLEVRIAGDGPERGSLEREIQDCGSQDRVKLLGQVEQMTHFYHQLDIFAMSSLTEQMPVAVLEAMASSLAVVSTDVGDVKEMVAEENRAYVVSDEKAMAEAIATIAGNDELRRRIGAANRRKVTEQYSEGKMLEAYRALYAKWLPTLSTHSGVIDE
jgi:glycosyltransferase involved in cell wall biosynthesis